MDMQNNIRICIKIKRDNFTSLKIFAISEKIC